MKAAFWVAVAGLALPLYSYLVYPLVLFVLASVVQTWRDIRYLLSRTDRRSQSSRMPSVSIIIAAYNEEDCIADTVGLCLDADYPEDRIEVIVGSDGSDDRTVEIVREKDSEGVRALDFSERRGKASVLRDCAEAATGDVLIFTDANTALDENAVRNLVRHFDDPEIGAVCGELRLLSPDGRSAREGIYWRYEVVLKMLESRLRAVLGANGGIYALRRELFPDISGNLITEDFVIPMKVRAQGYGVVYDPEAVAYEDAPSAASAEFRRRLRIGAGNWQALWHCAPLLLPWKGFVSPAFWSHKVLRWFTPFLLVAALVANLFLLRRPLWQGIMAVQLAFYGAALMGYTLNRFKLPAGPLRLASYFVSINAALGLGLVRGAAGLQRVTWRRTERENPSASENR